MPAVFALVALAYGDSRMFMAPAAVTPQIAQPRDVPATSAGAVWVAEPVLPAGTPVAYPTRSPSTVAAAAGAVLLAGVALTATLQRPATAVAEPDLEAAQDAAKVAMLFGSGKNSSGKNTKPKPKARRSAVNTTVKKEYQYFGIYERTPEDGNNFLAGFVQNFFTEKNWLYQAVKIILSLPENNADVSKKKSDNTQRGF